MKIRTGFVLLTLLGTVSAVLGFWGHPFLYAGTVLSLMGALLLAQLYGGR